MFLTYSRINFALVMRIIGLLLIVESIFMLLPTAACLIYDEGDLMAFVYSTIITAAVGCFLYFCLRGTRSQMGKREGFLLTALIWVVFSLFGMLPFLFGEPDVNISDAFFEAMSGFTTTGCSVLPNSALSHGITLWRCLSQWIGGMGIILFTLAVLPMFNHSGGMQMFNAEVTGITHDKLRPRIGQTAKVLWLIYIILTCVLITLLWIGPMNFFEALCHGFSTMSTGGFSTQDDSIAYWHSDYIDIILIIFMFIGGVNFGLIFKAAHGELSAFKINDSFHTYIKLIGLSYIIFVIFIIINGQFTSWQSITIAPLFQIVSTITSTGYTVNDFQQWGNVVLAIMFVLMFFGACAGSTSGGAKIDRLNYLLRNTHNEILRLLSPNAIFSVRINGRVISPEQVNKVIAFLCLYMLILVMGGIVLTAMGIPLIDAFFSSFSCMSNTGLGAGVTGYGGSYEIIPSAGKWVLSLLMLTGRLEIFTILVLFSRSFWLK